MLRRLRTAAILTLSTLLLLEVVLQVGALIVASKYGGTSGGAIAGTRVVLCVGDSFTYGLGATSQGKTSYPAQLQQQLDAAQAGAWSVVNESLPGRNSRGVLERIDSQLAAHRPEFVAILVGLNDRWAQPALLELDPSNTTGLRTGSGFRLEWRTRTFYLWLMGWLQEGAVPSGSGPQLAGVAPFEPTLAIDDPWRMRDAAREDAPFDGAPEEVATAISALPSTVDGSALPVLRAAAHLAATRPGLALRAAVRAFVLTGDRARFAEELRLDGAGYDPAQLGAVVDDLALRRPAHEAVAEAFADALGWRQGDGLWVHPQTGQQVALVTPRWLDFGEELLRVFDVHRAHIAQVVARCRAAGAEPFLVGYPNRVSFPDALLERISTDTGVPFLATVASFEERLGDRDRSALFVADGHCNDAGYGLLAEIVRRHLLQ